jgi:mycothiol synthase
MPAMFAIRPFEPTDAEYVAYAALQQAILPEYHDTVEEWKHRDEARNPKFLFRRFVVDVDGRMVAVGTYGEPWWSQRPGKYHVEVLVHPNYRRRGIGTALYDYLLGFVNELDPDLIISQAREDQADGLRFLAKRGFEPVMRYVVSHLDVPTFDPALFAGIVARVEKLGIQILPLTEVATIDDDWKRKLWELEWELTQDVSSPEPLTALSFENWEKQTLESPGFAPDGQYIALDRGRWVGMSALWTAQGEPEKLYTGLTGVVRSHRRKGIATALKVHGLGFARRYGAKVVETDNEENNPMYLLNVKLGFKPQPAWIDFEKRIKQERGQEG